MLRCIILSPDANLAARLESALGALDITVCRSFDRYPSGIDLIRTLRAQAPDVVFLSFESVELATETIKFLDMEGAGVQVIGFHRVCDAAVLRESMRVGLREFVSWPFEEADLVAALRNVYSVIKKQPPTHSATNDIFVFLPSKAGVGTSTLALNVSLALARAKEARVALADFDLNSGMMRFMLKLHNEYSVVDAVEHAPNMDENLWPQLVTSMGSLDVLHAGRVNPNLRIEPAQVRSLVQFMRRNYTALCFDLSGNLERYSLEIMHESKRVLLVCTPEISSLHLAREKLAFLKELDLEIRLGVVLNRCSKKPMFTKEQVEEVLGLSVMASLPNDYIGVNRAITEGKGVDPSSETGKNYAHFAQTLLDRGTAAPRAEQKRFIEKFSVPSMAGARE